MAGPFDFLQNIGQDIGQDVSNVGSGIGNALRGLLPSQPAQPQNPPLPTPPIGSPYASRGVPFGGASVSMPPPSSPQTGQGVGFLLQHPGDFMSETGLSNPGPELKQSLKDLPQNLDNLGSQLSAAKDLAGQDMTQDMQGLPGTTAQHQRVSKFFTDPMGYINDLVDNVVQPAINPEMWFTPDANPDPNYQAYNNLGIGDGGGHNYLRDWFSPAVKAITGEDVPDPTTAYQQKALALQNQQQQLMDMQDKLASNPNTSQADINAYNAKLSEYQANYNTYMSDYQHSADWWQNSTTAKILKLMGEGVGIPIQFWLGSKLFVPMMLSNPAQSSSQNIAMVKQGVDFAGALKDGSWKKMTADELTTNVSNIVTLGAMVYGGYHPAKGIVDGITSKFRNPDTNSEFISDLQQNIPAVKNPPGGPVDEAAQIAQARDASPVKEDPQAVQTRIADLQSSLARAQRMFQGETDPIMKKTLIEQIAGLGDEIRNLQNTPRTGAALEAQSLPYSKWSLEDLHAEISAVQSPEQFKQLIDELDRREGPQALDREVASWSDERLIREVTSLQNASNEDFNPDFADSLEKELENRGIFNQRDLEDFRALVNSVQAAAREKAQERGPSKIAPEIITDPAHPDYQWQSDKVLGNNYSFLEPRPEDFSQNVRQTAPGAGIQTVEDFAAATPVEIRQHLADTRFKPTTVDRLRGNGWIDPSGTLAIPISGSDYSSHEEFFSTAGISNEDGTESRILMDNGWIKKSSVAGLVGFGVRGGLSDAKIATINKAIQADMKGAIPKFPYDITDETSRMVISVSPQEFAAAGFDIMPAVVRREATFDPRFGGLQAFARQGEQIGTQGNGEAGQAGTPSTTSRPEGTPEGTTLASIIPRREGQTPIAFWKAGTKPAGAVSGGGGTSQLETRQAFLDAAIKAMDSVEDDSLKSVLLKGIKDEINKISPERLQAYIAQRNKEFYDTYVRVYQKYDPEGYVQHIVENHDMESEAEFWGKYPRTISYNPYKLLRASWAKFMGKTLYTHLEAVKDSVTPEAYQKVTAFLDQWTNATQAQIDENTIAEEIAHAYDVDHWMTERDYLAGIYSNPEWAQAAYAAGFGPPAGQPFEGSLADKISKFMQDPASVSSFDAKVIHETIAEYRASSLKVYWKAPLAGFTYRVPEVLKNEFKDPTLVQRAADAIGRDYETRIRPATRRWVASQSEARAAANAVPQGSIERGATSAAAGPPTGAGLGAANVPVGDVAAASAVRQPGPAGPDQTGLTDEQFQAEVERLRAHFEGRPVPPRPSTATKPAPRTTEGKALESVQPTPQQKGQQREVLQRTGLITQAITDLHAAGWPADVRWEKFAQDMADPNAKDHEKAMTLLDRLPPQTQEVFMKAVKSLPEPELIGGEAVGGAALREPLAPEVPSAPTANEMQSPQFKFFQQEIAAAQAKITSAGPIIRQMEASGESQKKINAEKAGLADLVAYRDALQNGSPPREAAQLGRQAFTAELNRLKALESYIGDVPELDEPFQEVYRGRKYNAVDDATANFIAKRLQLAGYELPVTKTGQGKGIEKVKQARLDDFFDSLFAQDRTAEEAYKRLPQATKEYLEAKIGYRGVPSHAKGKQKAQVVAAPPPEVAPGTENYINQTDQQGIENVVKIIPKKGGFAVIRHGSTARNGGAGQAERMRGWDDIPLNDEGERQAERIAAAFRGQPVAVIYASPMKRSLDTANAISKITGAKVIVDDNLKPWNVGEYSGKDAKKYGPILADLAKNNPDQKVPGGESFNDYMRRYIPAIQKHMQDALGLDGMTLEVNHTRGYRMAKSLIQSKGDPRLPVRDGITNKEEIGPGGIMGMQNVNGVWQIAGDYVSDPFDPTKKTWVNGEASQKFAIPAGEEGVKPATKTTAKAAEATPAKNLKDVYASVDPMVGAAKKGVKQLKTQEVKAAKIKGELPVVQDINSQIDAIAADPTHPANASAVEAKTYRDLLPSAEEMGGSAYENIKAKYAASLQRLTTRLLQVAKNQTKIAEAEAPKIADKALFDKTAKAAESLRKRIDKGEDADVVARDAAKVVGLTHKQALSALADKNWSTGKAQSWAPALQELILGKAAQKIRENRLSNKPGRKNIPFEQDQVMTHEPKMKPAKPETAAKTPKNETVPAIAKTLQRDSKKRPNVVVPEKVEADARRDVTRKIAEASKKTTKQLRDESREIEKQINTPSPNPFVAEHPTEAKKGVNLASWRKSRRKDGFEEPGMRDGTSSQEPPPPDGPGNVLASWDDARDPVRAYGGKWAKLAEVMDLLVKNYAESTDPGRNQLHHLEKYRVHMYDKAADSHLMSETLKAMQDVLPDFKTNKDLHRLIASAVETKDETARKRLQKQMTPQQAAFVDMWRSWEDVKGKIKVDNDLMKAGIEDYIAHVLKFDENGKALLGRDGKIRSGGMSQRLKFWIDRAVVTEADVEAGRAEPDQIGQVRWPTLEALRKNFGENNVEEDLTKIFLQENLSFSTRLRMHQAIEDLSQHLVTSEESFGLGGKKTLPYEGYAIVPASKINSVPRRYRDQLDTVRIGPGRAPLSNYYVYKPLKDLIERQADIDEDARAFNKLATPLRSANNLFKLYKFTLNPLHMYNVTSDIDAYLSKSVFRVPMVGVVGMYKRIYDVKNGRSTWDTPVGELNWNEMMTAMARNGATVRKNLIDTANLGSLSGHIQPLKVFGHDVNIFNRFNDFMWHDVVWMGHIAATQHLADFYMKQMADANPGEPINEAQFNHALRLAAQQSNAMVGFLDRMDMSRNWNIIGNTVNFANAWSTMQIRNVGGGLKGLPGADYLKNFGGGERYLDTLTKILPEGGLKPEDMNLMNSIHGSIARRFVVNGTLKLLAASTVMSYVGSYIAVLTGQNGAQLSGPWQNFQKDPTHVFDIYGGIDPNTGKQIWYHNPLYNAISELIDYGMQGVKAANAGKDWTQVVSSPAVSYASGKANPFLSQIFAMISGQEMNRWMEGYSNASIHNDPSVLAIENALSAKGYNLPVGLEDRLIYAIREVGPVPGFAPTYGTGQTLNTAGDITNAVGPGKYFGIGDFLNALQSGNFTNLVPTDLGNLAMFITGSRMTETATPDQVATDSQFAQASSDRTQKQQLEQQMLQAAYKGDYKTVAVLSNKLQYDNNQMVNALLYPPSGMGGGIAYHGTPYQAPASSATQDTLLGVTLQPGQTAELEALKKANFLAMYNEIVSTPGWQSEDGSSHAAEIQSIWTQVEKAVNNQYAQQIGLMGGSPIQDGDIQQLIAENLRDRGLATAALSTSDVYMQADSTEQARMLKEYQTFAADVAYKAVFGAYKGVPPERVQALISDTIQMEEQTRQYLQGSVFYQMATPEDQARMLTEYATLSRTITEKFALGQGQGSRGDITLMADQVPMVIEKTIQVEETAKALLHSTDYYQTADLATQNSLDSKYSTLARSLAFSPTAYTENPDIIVENSIMAEESYFGLQNQFGGGNYLKLMAQQLSDMELTLRQTSDYSPREIASMEKALRANFLAQNPTYANYLRAKTYWSKNTTVGQIYSSLNNAEFAAQDDLAAADALSSSVLTSGTSSDPYFDPAANMGLTDMGLGTLGPIGGAPGQ